MQSLFPRLSVLLAALCLALAPAHAKRLALVIGNDNYQFTEKLVNAGNDANAMAKALQAAGFKVTRHHDLPRQALFKAVDSFAQGVAKDDEVVVFFSGHGVQIDAAPYLLPVDIKADTARQVTRDGLALDALVGDLSKARFTLVVVDACRNNPFAVRGQRSLGADKGLQPIEPPEGTAIIFSAGRGQAALDTLGQNDSERQGVFTREFLKQMTAPGLQVRDLLLKVRDSVEQQAASVNHKQRPALIDETRGLFYFYPPSAGGAPRPGLVTPVSEALAIEIAYWNSLQDSGGVQELQLYLRRYPHGQFADLAQARLARLTAAPGVATPTTAAAAPPAALAPDPRTAGEGDGEAQRLRALAQKGNAAAMSRLALLYRTGRNGLAKDEAQALRWFRKGAEAGNGAAMAGLGFMYESGMGGLPKDPAQALSWYRKGAETGDGQAMNNLAAAYANGRGVAKDDAQAVVWYRRAVESGNTRAMANLGWLHETGRGGLARDEREALSWYRRGAEAGNGYAMALLGFRYESGRAGLAKDDAQALAWYRKGVEAGDPLAMNNLGSFYASGRAGLPRDEAEALAWYRKAAALGEGFAMNNLGLWYAGGRGGLPQDRALARQWYERAVAVGNEPAKTNLAKLQ